MLEMKAKNISLVAAGTLPSPLLDLVSADRWRNMTPPVSSTGDVSGNTESSSLRRSGVWRFMYRLVTPALMGGRCWATTQPCP